jgi:hypothetical protein
VELLVFTEAVAFMGKIGRTSNTTAEDNNG